MMMTLSLVVTSDRPADAAGRLIRHDESLVRGEHISFSEENYFSWKETRALSDADRAHLLRVSFGNWCAKNGW